MPDDDEHRGRRIIKSSRAIAAGADDIHQVGSVAAQNRRCKFSHDLGRCSDFADGFFLYAQANGQRSDHWRRHFAAHDAAEQRQHFIVKDFAMLNATQQDILFGDWHMTSLLRMRRRARRVRHRGVPVRRIQAVLCTKLRSSAWPCSDRIDSGWNCTPSISTSLCRTPMISPSSAQAVISRQAGIEERSMASE